MRSDSAGGKDMDLSPLTPCSARYAGYTIEKGKLSPRLLEPKALAQERKETERDSRVEFVLK